MELTSKNIEEYIRRFMDGETTNEEEKAIYRYFRTQQVPAHLKSYQAMFVWYEEGMPQERLDIESPSAAPFVHKKASWWKRIPLEIRSMGIAAMLALVVGLGVLAPFEDNQGDEWACYEGSYVVINGKRNSNIDEIMPQILATLRQAEETEKWMQEQLDAIKRMEEYAEEKGKIIINN